MRSGSVVDGARRVGSCLVLGWLALAAPCPEVRAAGSAVCDESAMRAYELRFVEVTPAGPIDPAAGPVVALAGAPLDAAAMARLAERFGGGQAAGMAWGYLLTAVPGEELNFHGDIPAPWGRRLSLHGGPASDPSRHALTIETADAKALVELSDGETRAFVVAESKRGRVVALLTAGPCDEYGLSGAAIGLCASNARKGVTPPALTTTPTAAKPGTHRYVNVDVSGRGLVRFVVAETGAIVDPLVLLERMNAAEVDRALGMTLEGRQYAPALEAGRPVAYCVVDAIAPFGVSTGTRPAAKP